MSDIKISEGGKKTEYVPAQEPTTITTTTTTKSEPVNPEQPAPAQTGTTTPPKTKGDESHS